MKPKGLLHPDELWKHTAFDSAEEYAVWCDTPTKLGKPTKACPFGGMAKQRYHDWADKIWEKFKLLKREILAATAVRSTLYKSNSKLTLLLGALGKTCASESSS